MDHRKTTKWHLERNENIYSWKTNELIIIVGVNVIRHRPWDIMIVLGLN